MLGHPEILGDPARLFFCYGEFALQIPVWRMVPFQFERKDVKRVAGMVGGRLSLL